MTDTVNAPTLALTNVTLPKARLLLNFAWAAEIIGAAMGVVNSASITFGDTLPDTFSTWLYALPAAVLALFELARIPLIKAAREKLRGAPQLLALAGAVLLIGVAFENWTLGLERMVNFRLSVIELARDDLREVQRTIADVKEAIVKAATRRAEDRTALQGAVVSGQARVDAITAQMAQEDANHVKLRADAVAACMKLAIICADKRAGEEDDRYKAVQAPLSKARAQAEATRDAADAALHNMATVNDDRGALADLTKAEAKARLKLTREARSNPIYRVAASYFRHNAEDVTDEELAATRTFFAMFGAAIISILGTVAALVHYWPDTVGKPSKLARALRAYIARLRRQVVRLEKVEVPVEKIVEKIVPEVEKPILIEKTIVRFVPYTGEGPLPSDEATVKRVEGILAEEALSAARANNAKHLRVYK